MKTCKLGFVLFSVFVVVLVFAGAANADCSATNCNGKIERAYFSGARLFIATDGDETALNCTSPAGVYVTIPTSDPDFDRKYAMVLTAMSLDATVGLRIVEGDAHCSLSYIFMDK